MLMAWPLSKLNVRSWHNEGSDVIQIAPFGSYAAHGRGRSKVNLWLMQPSRSDWAEARPNTQSDTKAEEGYIDTVYGRC